MKMKWLLIEVQDGGAEQSIYDAPEEVAKILHMPKEIDDGRQGAFLRWAYCQATMGAVFEFGEGWIIQVDTDSSIKHHGVLTALETARAIHDSFPNEESTGEETMEGLKIGRFSSKTRTIQQRERPLESNQ